VRRAKLSRNDHEAGKEKSVETDASAAQADARSGQMTRG
jgi:hypothetical protein